MDLMNKKSTDLTDSRFHFINNMKKNVYGYHLDLIRRKKPRKSWISHVLHCEWVISSSWGGREQHTLIALSTFRGISRRHFFMNSNKATHCIRLISILRKSEVHFRLFANCNEIIDSVCCILFLFALYFFAAHEYSRFEWGAHERRNNSI